MKQPLEFNRGKFWFELPDGTHSFKVIHDGTRPTSVRLVMGDGTHQEVLVHQEAPVNPEISPFHAAAIAEVEFELDHHVEIAQAYVGPLRPWTPEQN